VLVVVLVLENPDPYFVPFPEFLTRISKGLSRLWNHCGLKAAFQPNAPLFRTRHFAPVPLSELEKLIVVTTCGGNTDSHHMIYRSFLVRSFSASSAGLLVKSNTIIRTWYGVVTKPRIL
jgi:hypothetical protein